MDALGVAFVLGLSGLAAYGAAMAACHLAPAQHAAIRGPLEGARFATFCAAVVVFAICALTSVGALILAAVAQAQAVLS